MTTRAQLRGTAPATQALVGAAFAEMVSSWPAPVAALARRARALIFDVLPQTVEVVWPRQGTAGTRHRVPPSRR